MVLNESQIRERLSAGSLSIFPLGEDDVSPGSVELRLGSEFAEYPSAGTATYIDPLEVSLKTFRPTVRRVEVGERIILPPHVGILVTSLQFFVIPQDVIGRIEGRATLGRLGLLVSGSTVHPGFQGKVAFPLYNITEIPIALYSGMRVAHLTLSSMQGGEGWLPRKYDDFDITPSEDLAPLVEQLESASEQAKAEYVPEPGLAVLLDEALRAGRTEKGRLLEKFTAELVKMIEGLKVIRTNAQLSAEEIDLLVQNDISVGFWRHLGSPMIIECKNWASKVSAREISILGDKLSALSPDAKTAILVAPNGVTGTGNADAWLKIRELRQRGRYIIVIDGDMLKRIATGDHPADVIEAALQTVWLI